jgi:hypothetical protein
MTTQHDTNEKPHAAGQAAHTPTPWLSWNDYDEDGDTGDILIGANTLSSIVVVQDGIGNACPKANAAFIVRACNSHAILMAALEAIVARIDGDWDKPELMAVGALSIDTEADCSLIARRALFQAKSGGAK